MQNRITVIANTIGGCNNHVLSMTMPIRIHPKIFDQIVTLASLLPPKIKCCNFEEVYSEDAVPGL